MEYYLGNGVSGGEKGIRLKAERKARKLFLKSIYSLIKTMTGK